MGCGDYPGGVHSEWAVPASVARFRLISSAKATGARLQSAPTGGWRKSGTLRFAEATCARLQSAPTGERRGARLQGAPTGERQCARWQSAPTGERRGARLQSAPTGGWRKSGTLHVCGYRTSCRARAVRACPAGRRALCENLAQQSVPRRT